jgi:hypothetical protein
VANIIIKSDDRVNRQNKIMNDFKADYRKAENREYAEYIAEKSHEVQKEMRKNERSK